MWGRLDNRYIAKSITIVLTTNAGRLKNFLRRSNLMAMDTLADMIVVVVDQLHIPMDDILQNMGK